MQFARRYYNGSVRDNNNLVEGFPSMVIAKAFGFIGAAFFEIELASQRAAPEIRLENSHDPVLSPSDPAHDFAFLPLSMLADERILEYRSDIHVHENGQLTVSEFIRVRAEGQNIRRGIYRDFPTRYRDRLGNYINVDFIPLSVHRNGKPEAWHTKEMSNGVRVYAGSEAGLVEPGVHDYELVFATNRQLGFFEDHDELYFNAIGNGWIFPIDKAVATVTLPFQVSADQLSLSLYMGRYGSKETSATAEVISTNEGPVRNDPATAAKGGPDDRRRLAERADRRTGTGAKSPLVPG